MLLSIKIVPFIIKIVYCPDSGNLKGESTRTNPNLVLGNIIKTPDGLVSNNKEIKLSTSRPSIYNLNFDATILCNLF